MSANEGDQVTYYRDGVAFPVSFLESRGEDGKDTLVVLTARNHGGLSAGAVNNTTANEESSKKDGTYHA